MKKTEYTAALDKTIFLGSGQVEAVARLLSQIESNKELSDDDRLEIETHARSISVIPAPLGLPEDKPSNNSGGERRRVFPRYEFDEMLLFPDGLQEYGFDENCADIHRAYAQWLISAYLPTFHPMPDESHQHPIAACLMLLNCKAVLSRKQCIPIPYFLGMNGSGKTELAKSIAQHYPRQLWTEIRPNNTGASIRDNLDNLFCGGEPGFALFDNFHPRTSLDRLGSHYDIILANCEESAISRISATSKDVVKSEFRTYCYKAFTSIFDLSLQGAEEFGEIARRCIILKFKEAKPKGSRTIWDWEGQQRVYQRVWGEEFISTGKKEYGKILGGLARLNPIDIPIPGKVWNICQVPIAVGVYCGIFTTANEGIAHFARHFEWLKKNGNNAVGSALAIVLTKYVKEELPRLVAEVNSNPFASKKNAVSIDSFSQESVTKYLQDKTGFAVSKQQLDEIIQLLNNLGYHYSRMGQAMGFIKDGTIPDK